eukprot:TRINITY_DN2182_c0_g1_i1.p1 TRINITY_DN2182_c0_g1~~TRINITY_DN2182_c0_g1_i1.p1  ORF type:complete len:123 (+),score=28.94 TRINITY_DN2182_c0_g1_i1:213-581(+)
MGNTPTSIGSGQRSSTLGKAEVDELESQTHCMWFNEQANVVDDQNDLKELHRQWKKEVPNGVITRKDFKDFLRDMGMTDELVQDLIFNTFDGNKDGNISFREFVSSLSVMTRGTPEEKLACV